MPIKCFYKPNRTEPYLPRKFHARDAARVARYAVTMDGAPAVFRSVADELGFRGPLCATMRIIRALDRLEDKLGSAKVISAVLTVVSGIIKVVKKLPLKRFPWVGALLIALGLLQGILTGLKEALDELEPIQQAIEVLSPLCDESPEK